MTIGRHARGQDAHFGSDVDVEWLTLEGTIRRSGTSHWVINTAVSAPPRNHQFSGLSGTAMDFVAAIIVIVAIALPLLLLFCAVMIRSGITILRSAF